MDGTYYQTTVDHWALRLVEYIIEPLQEISCFRPIPNRSLIIPTPDSC